MSIGRKEFIKKLMPAFLIAAFSLISLISFSSISQLQGNARIVNYTGIVRGATQRLIKQELNQKPNDELIAQLDSILSELSGQKGENRLNAPPDTEFQNHIQKMNDYWQKLKQEIYHVRKSPDGQALFDMSEAYFNMADAAVSSMELYSEAKVSQTALWLIGLNFVFIVFVILFWIYDTRQKRFSEALAAAEHANHEKSAFLSRMSHEIRTPMNGIIGMTAIAKLSVYQPQKVLDCLEKIESSSSFLLSLINDILDMSRIESGKIDLCEEAFDLQALTERIQIMVNQKAESSQIKLLIQTKGIPFPYLIGDELRISQILINISSNAIKFTPTGGTVTLAAKQTEKPDGIILNEFTITDTGIGMSKEFQERMFDPFEQAQASISRQYGGTGLGLTISYNLIKKMGGTITVNSTPGKGSQFIISLPLRRAEKQHLPSINTVSEFTDLSGLKILLAEDNPLNSEIATVLLEKDGACIEPVWNGNEAVDRFLKSAKGEFDFILMDIQMPELDGLQAAAKIRSSSHPDAQTVPIIGLSANAFQSDALRAKEFGMNHYLTKPIDLQQLQKVAALYKK